MPQVHRELAHAKLTRSLRVIGRRADGLHLIEAEMVTIGLADEIEFTLSSSSTIEVTDATALRDGQDLVQAVPTDERNLVLRALRLVDRPASVVLRKRIPAGAGLGGGSADAAAALRFAGCADVELAATLGADVPFCLVGGRAEVSGVGEAIRRLPHLDLHFVVLSPAIAVSTAAVYQAYDVLSKGEERLPPAPNGNDLEAAALVVEPRLGRYRELFGDLAGRPPLLAGSGASWFIECTLEVAARLGPMLESALHSAGAPAWVNVCSSVPPQPS